MNPEAPTATPLGTPSATSAALTPALSLETRSASSPAPLHLFENHDQAYYLWRDSGLRDRILVHIDAHHDMWWLDDNRGITIANFICPALKEGIVREVWWVVPDPTWDSREGRNAVRKHLRRILKKYPQSSRRPRINGASATATVLGKPLTVCALNSLPCFDEPVLLDIDTDYLIIRSVAYGSRDAHGPIPWRWPEHLAAQLKARNLRSALTTIVYSVEGGYTPLKWKYLGDELAARLSDPPDDRAAAAYRLISAAASGAPAPEEALAYASLDLPASPAVAFHRALLAWREGRRDDARRLYAEAVALDPSYRSAFFGGGFLLQWQRRWKQAEQAHRAVLEIDPESWHPLVGLAQIAERRGRRQEAEELFRRALAAAPESLDALRGLAKLLARRGEIDEAIRLYETSLRLALHGRRPISGPIVAEDTGRLLDNGHMETYNALAALYARRGEINRAINCLRICVAGRWDTAAVRCRLTAHYLRRRVFGSAASHLAFIPVRGLVDLWYFLRRMRRRIKRLLEVRPGANPPIGELTV